MQIDELRRLSQAHQAPMPSVHTDNSMPMSGAGDRASKNDEALSVQLAGFSGFNNSPFYDKNSIKDESLVEDIAGKAESFSSAQNMKQELSMAASGVSDQDIDELKEKGYSPRDMDAEGIRTVTDQIKEQLVKGGADLGAMEGLSMEAIEEYPGGREAYAMAMEIAQSSAVTSEGMSGNAAEYLVSNQLPPTIENTYQAVFSSVAGSMPPGADVDMEALDSQVRDVIDGANLAADEVQIDNARELISKNIPLTSENLEYFNELTTYEFDITKESVIEMIDTAVSEGNKPGEAYLLAGYSLKDRAVTAYDTIQKAGVGNVAAAMDENGNVTVSGIKQNMAREELGLDTAKPERSAAADLSENEIHARRLLEETRLVMTREANLSLLKRGISIDTTDLEELVEELKYEEQAFYRTQLTGGEEISEADLSKRIEQFDNTNSQVETLKELPAVLLGKIPEAANATVDDLVSAGKETLVTFKAAGERYETMGTEVRRDLGDSINKAFRNVDDILEDIGLETSDKNERAVRILAYNQKEITPDSVLEMKAADEKVSKALSSLTPGVVAKMIKAGENPLDLSIDRLRERAQEIRNESSMDSDEENYARFLYKAEQANEITEEERDAFIGVYRLIYQVEKTDGAVIGQLLNQGAEITLRNMMGAVRTRRSAGMEFTVDAGSAGFEATRTELTITEQIEKAFMTERMKDAGEAMTPGRMQQFENEDSYMNMNPDQFASALERMVITREDEAAELEYKQQTAQNIRAAIDSEQQVYDIINRFDIGGSPANIEAINEMLKNRNGMFMRLFPGGSRRTFGEVSDSSNVEDVEISDIKEDIMEAFGEAVKTPEDMAEAQMKLEEIATNVMKDFLIEQKVRQVDVRGMQMSIKQIKACGDMGRKSETYAIPIMVSDTMGNMSLKIVRGREPERGAVDISLDMESVGAVSMTLKVSADGVSGKIESDRRETAEALARHQETIISAIGMENVNIDFSVKSGINANDIYNRDSSDYGFETADPNEEKEPVQTRTLYNIARSLIDAVSALG